MQKYGQGLDQLVGMFPFPLLVVDSKDRIEVINSRFAQVFGYTLDDVATLRRWLEKAFPEKRLRRKVISAWEADLKTGPEAQTPPHSFEMVCKDGAVRDILFQMVKIGEGRRLILCEDITERKQAEDINRVLADISAAAAKSEDLRDLIRTIREHLGLLLDTTNFYVALYDENTGLYSIPYYEDEYDKLEEFENIPLGKSLTDYVRRKGKSLLLDQQLHSELIELGEVDGVIGTDSPIWLGVPLITAHGPIGVVGVQSYDDKSLYSEKDMELLNFVAGHIALIVERKRAEEALRESEARYRSLIETSPDAIILTDLEGNLLMANQEAARLLGVDSVEELLSGEVNAFDLIAPEDRQRSIANVRKTLEERGVRAEYKVLRMDGGTFPAEMNVSLIRDAEGKPEAFIGVVRDITGRREAEEVIRQSEENLATTLDSIGDAVIATDEDGKVVRMNPVAETLTGWKTNEAAGRDLAEIFRVVDEGGEPLESPVEGVIREGKVVELAEHTELVSLDGTERRITHSAAPIRGRDGVINGVVLVFRDVTESYKLQKQLQQSQKMEAIGQLAGGIAHDFNNLLTVIQGNADLGLMKTESDSTLRKEFEEIRKTARRASELTHQILAYSRRLILSPKIIDLNDVIASMDSMLRRIIGEDVILRTVGGEGLWNVKADPTQLEQVIVNLAVNGRDAMPKGGKLTIETANVELDESYAKTHPVSIAGPYVMLSVSDTGCGMSEEVKKNIFEPFYTTKIEGRGTGLGLSTVYGIVKQSGGYIFVYSELGKGTCFKVYMPRVMGEAEEIATEEAQDQRLEGSETILVVEDEDEVREMTARILEEYGYSTIKAGSGKEALKACKRMKDEIDMLLTDVVMPEMSGGEVAEAICRIFPNVKVLFMSGYAENAIVHHGELKPGTPYINKPFGTVELARKVRRVLDGSLD